MIIIPFFFFFITLSRFIYSTQKSIADSVISVLHLPFPSLSLIANIDVSTNEALKKGSWDSVHVFSVSPASSSGEFEYTLTSSIIISMNLNEDTTGNVDLSGNIMDQITKTAKV